jgi:hypothetical protein
MIRISPGPPSLSGAEPIDPAERARLRSAALRARRLYPGDLGVLAARELRALADLGVRFDPDALIPRLATAILAAELPEAGQAQ